MVIEVQGFLNTSSVLRIFIKGYLIITQLLIHLTYKNAIFKFRTEELKAIEKMKQAIMNSPTLMAINYESEWVVIL